MDVVSPLGVAEDVAFPDHWSEEAVAAAEVILDESPDLSGAAWALLMSIGEQLTAAAAQEEIARAAGWVTTGSTGQIVAHPSAIAAHSARTAANAMIARLIRTDDKASRSQLGRSLARARWSK
jgi:hypothetical protein